MRQRVQNLRAAKTAIPMVRALELAGRRWALRVVWELRTGALSFRGIQVACGNISPSVLATRLRELGDLGVVENIPRLGYRLTASGERLFQVLAELNKWSVLLPKHSHGCNK